MTEILCTVAVLMSALSLIIALVGALMTLRLGKGLTVHVVTTQPDHPAPTVDEIAARVQRLQAEADKARKEEDRRIGFDEILSNLNEIMLGGPVDE